MNYGKCKRDKLNLLTILKKFENVKIALFRTIYPFHLLFCKVKMGGVQSFTKGFLKPYH